MTTDHWQFTTDALDLFATRGGGLRGQPFEGDFYLVFGGEEAKANLRRGRFDTEGSHFEIGHAGGLQFRVADFLDRHGHIDRIGHPVDDQAASALELERTVRRFGRVL